MEGVEFSIYWICFFWMVEIVFSRETFYYKSNFLEL